MTTLPVRIGWRRGEPEGSLVTREWIVTNGLGGYACGTLGGLGTRRFHGLLVAALGAPHGRTLYVAHLDESLVRDDGRAVALSGTQRVGEAPSLPNANVLASVALEGGLPLWRFEDDGVVLEKRIVVPHAQNTAYAVYRLVSAKSPVTLRVAPALRIRPHEGRLADPGALAYAVEATGDAACSVQGDDPSYPPVSLAMQAKGAAKPRLTVETGRTPDLFYREEHCRGYDDHGPLFTLGAFEVTLTEGDEVALVATVETAPAAPFDEALACERQRREALIAAADSCAHEGIGAELVLAADAFIIQPYGRREKGAGSGDTACTVIAGYHWFTDWGRDTMISLEGLTLLTGRHEEAKHILRMFASHVKDGLLPNLFPEGDNEGLYHTADATMWFFHALARYVETTDDRETLRLLLPTMIDIVQHHLAGTRFGIRVDPQDGLLTQGAAGYQLTWMDAKVDGWVVTPRRGKAVEINALFYNALRTLEGWLRDEGRDGDARAIAAQAETTRASFNRRFWYEAGGHLYDVVDGEDGKDDPSLRPNQVFAISLPHPVLDRARWEPVVAVVRERLLTPVGLRSLAPGHRDYKRAYDGDLRARDAAYHQGTVWGWLIGPFLDAWNRVHPDDANAATRIVSGFAPHLGEAALGTISEIFDAESPYTPRGCVAQAWSVAEALRCFVRSKT